MHDVERAYGRVPPTVGVVESLGDLADDERRELDRERPAEPPAPPEHGREIRTGHVLHRDEIRVVRTSEIEDLDYAKAVTQMNKDMMAMQAAMGSFSKISGLSLFEYIR